MRRIAKKEALLLCFQQVCVLLFEVVLGIHNIVLGHSSGYAKTKIIALNVDQLAVVF